MLSLMIIGSMVMSHRTNPGRCTSKFFPHFSQLPGSRTSKFSLFRNQNLQPPQHGISQVVAIHGNVWQFMTPMDFLYGTCTYSAPTVASRGSTAWLSNRSAFLVVPNQLASLAAAMAFHARMGDPNHYRPVLGRHGLW